MVSPLSPHVSKLKFADDSLETRPGDSLAGADKDVEKPNRHTSLKNNTRVKQCGLFRPTLIELLIVG